jgi:hypothetical protein
MVRHSVKFIAALAIGMAGWSAVAASQDCPASVAQLPQGWASMPLPASTKTSLKPVALLKCSDCVPELGAEVGSGLSARSMRPTGLAWAETIVSSPIARAKFLGGVLTGMRSRAPGCIITGEIDGVTTTDALGFVTATTRERCLPQQTEVTELSYSGYDGKCLHQLSVAWKGTAELGPQARGRVHDLLQSIKFGQ